MSDSELGVAEAKRRFAELIDRVGDGETFVISRHGKPVVALVAPQTLAGRWSDRPVGLAAMAGALADWDDLEQTVADIYRARR